MNKKVETINLRDLTIEHIKNFVNDFEYIKEQDIFQFVNKITKYSFNKCINLVRNLNELTTRLLQNAFYTSNITQYEISIICVCLIVINANLESIHSTSATIRQASTQLIISELDAINDIVQRIRLN